jgi:hypothetical protein
MAEERPVVLDLVPLGQAQLERSQVNNQVFSGGIKDGSDFLPTLSLRGRQFHIKTGKNEKVSLEDRRLEVIMVTARADLSKQYYAGKYDPEKAGAPDCKSADGKVPDPDVAKPMSVTCATCRMNAWGSKINEITGKEAKACADHKVLILAPPTLDSEKPLQLQLPAASLKNLGLYIKLLNHNGLAANEVVTELSFTVDDAFPKLAFKYKRNLTSNEIGKTKEIEVREDVLATIKTPDAAPPPVKNASEQQTVVQNVTPSADTPPPADDKPSDEVASILSRWGATAKK